MSFVAQRHLVGQLCIMNQNYKIAPQ